MCDSFLKWQDISYFGRRCTVERQSQSEWVNACNIINQGNQPVEASQQGRQVDMHKHSRIHTNGQTHVLTDRHTPTIPMNEEIKTQKERKRKVKLLLHKHYIKCCCCSTHVHAFIADNKTYMVCILLNESFVFFSLSFSLAISLSLFLLFSWS